MLLEVDKQPPQPAVLLCYLDPFSVALSSSHISPCSTGLAMAVDRLNTHSSEESCVPSSIGIGDVVSGTATIVRNTACSGPTMLSQGQEHWGSAVQGHSSCPNQTLRSNCSNPANIHDRRHSAASAIAASLAGAYASTTCATSSGTITGIEITTINSSGVHNLPNTPLAGQHVNSISNTHSMETNSTGTFPSRHVCFWSNDAVISDGLAPSGPLSAGLPLAAAASLPTVNPCNNTRDSTGHISATMGGPISCMIDASSFAKPIPAASAAAVAAAAAAEMQLAAQLQHQFLALSHVPCMVTMFNMHGQVVYQNGEIQLIEWAQVLYSSRICTVCCVYGACQVCPVSLVALLQYSAACICGAFQAHPNHQVALGIHLHIVVACLLGTGGCQPLLIRVVAVYAAPGRSIEYMGAAMELSPPKDSVAGVVPTPLVALKRLFYLDIGSLASMWDAVSQGQVRQWLVCSCSRPALSSQYAPPSINSAPSLQCCIDHSLTSCTLCLHPAALAWTGPHASRWLSDDPTASLQPL